MYFKPKGTEVWSTTEGGKSAEEMKLRIQNVIDGFKTTRRNKDLQLLTYVDSFFHYQLLCIGKQGHR